MNPLAAIRQIISRHAGDGLTPTALPGVSVLCATRTSAPIGDTIWPTFALVAGGVKDTMVNRTSFRYGAGHYLIAAVDLPVVGTIVEADEHDPFLAVAIDLRPDRVAALLLDTARSSVLLPDAPPAGIGVSRASEPLLDAVARLLALLDAPADAPALAEGIEREILWRLLTGPQGATLRQIGIADSHLTHVARAIRWIRDHYEQPLRVEDLAAIAAMSPSSFHRHFRAVTTMTPLQYQKHLRLNTAHLRLLSADTDVASVGFSVGYVSPSQFSREYHRMFGFSPGRTGSLRQPVADRGGELVGSV